MTERPIGAPATALVHEVYLRLARSEKAYQNRQHLLSTASAAMRQILVDHAARAIETSEAAASFG